MNATLHRRSFRSSPALLFTAALAAQAPPAVPILPEAGLPASTYACVHFGGLAQCSAATREQPLAAVVLAFLQRISPSIREHHLEQAFEQPTNAVRRAIESSGMHADDVRALLSCPMTIAVGRLSIEGMGPSLALVIEEGEKRRQIERCFGVVEHAAVEHGAVAPGEPVRLDDVVLHRVDLPTGAPIFHGSMGGRYVVSNSRGYVRELLAVTRGKGRPLTAAGIGVSEGVTPLASLFVNTAPLADAIAPFLPYESDAWSAALGVGRLDSIEATTSASVHGGSDMLRVALHGRKDGLLKALVARPVDFGFASMCTNDTVVFAAGSLDVPAVIGAFDRFVALLPAAAQHEVRNHLARELRSPELAAAVAAFGPRVALSIAAAKGGVPKPEVLLRVECRDRAAAAHLLQRVERLAGHAAHLEWGSRAVGDREIRFCSVEIPGAHVQLAPCYALLDDAVVFGSDVASLVRAMRTDVDPATTLAAQPDFIAMTKTSRAASGVVYARTFRAVELQWRTVESFVFPLVDQNAEVLGFDSEALPDTETMAKAVGTSTFSFTVDDEGLSIRHDGTFAFGALLAAIGAVGDEVLLRASTRTY